MITSEPLNERAPPGGSEVTTETTVEVTVVANLEVDVTVWVLALPPVVKYSPKPETAKRASTTIDARY